MILKSVLGNDKAYIKSLPSERKSKLRVLEQSPFEVGGKRKRKGFEGNEERKEVGKKSKE